VGANMYAIIQTSGRQLRVQPGGFATLDGTAGEPGAELTLGNVLCGLGMAAAGFGPIFGAISRQTPQNKRSVALGVTTAGGSFGQFAIVPFASLLQYRLDNWHTTMLILGVMSMAMVPLALGLRESSAGGLAPARIAPIGWTEGLCRNLPPRLVKLEFIEKVETE